jgi:hypothetical protein
VLVTAYCPQGTSTPPQKVVVFDGGSPASNPSRLGVLGFRSGVGSHYDYFLAGAPLDVETDGTTITLSGPARSGQGPYCCPDQSLTLRYRWQDDTFVQVARKVTPR